MIRTTVNYFFNSEGLAYFKNWIKELEMEFSKRDGFIKSAWEVQPVADKQCEVIVRVDFENTNKLTTWLATEAHEKLACKIRPHFIKSPLVRRENGI